MPQKVSILSATDPLIAIAAFPLVVLPTAVSHLRTNSDQAQDKGSQRH